jgi:hypothetical protein
MDYLKLSKISASLDPLCQLRTIEHSWLDITSEYTPQRYAQRRYSKKEIA